MRINVLLKSDDYRGDHAADVTIAFAPDPTETIAELVHRIAAKRYRNGSLKPTDVIEIRPVLETDDAI